jgi:uncharacterized protein (TIGR02996 family)
MSATVARGLISSRVSFFHYVPDPAVVPCLGCNGLVRERDLVKHSRHMGKSTFFWHPYHFWCVRDAPPGANQEPTCADCGGPLMVEQMQRVLRWGMTFEGRLRQRMILASGEPVVHEHPDAAVPRPPGLRLVAVGRMLTPEPIAIEAGWHPVLDEDEIVLESYVRRQFEMVHDACPDDEPLQLRTQLRAAPDDADLREVYADWLEEQGERVRAEFARLVVARHRGTAQTSELRALRDELPGSWIKDVVGAL